LRDTTESDEELLLRFKKTGNSEYFGQLYNRYIPLIYGLSLKYLQNTELAEDAVMDIFEDLLPKIANYEIREFRTWIYSVAKNHAFHALNNSKLAKTVEIIPEIMESDDIVSLFEEEETDEAHRKALYGCMEQLPDVQRDAIRMFFLEDMSYADIVETTGFQLKSVKSHIQNGKRNLRICLDKKLKR
jgi:RNA polymerase sigma-70 factor, ECF subfamily